jgi:hypothetical protein
LNTRRKILIITSLAAAVVPGQFVVAATAAHASSDTVTGIVFRDYDANGRRDVRTTPGGKRILAPGQYANETAHTSEPGEPGIEVQAFDDNGHEAHATTDANGAYTLDVDDFDHNWARVEFVIPISKSFLAQSAVGVDNRGDVQTVKIGSSNVNFAVANPSEYCHVSKDLRLATNCWKYGDQRDSLAAIESWSYTASRNSIGQTDPTRNVEATTTSIGTTFGLAWQRSTRVLFAGAYARRHSGYGALGPGGIYAIKQAGTTFANGSPYADLNALFPADMPAGANTHPAVPSGTMHANGTADERAWFHDAASYDSVGKAGLGGLAIGEDDAYLYTVALADRRLYKLSATTAPTAANIASTVTRASTPHPASCPDADVRPFAITMHDGDGYLGIVCSAESTPATPSNVRGYVYRFDPKTLVFEADAVVDVPLYDSYPRSSADDNTEVDQRWMPWSSVIPDTYPVFNSNQLKPQPALGSVGYSQTKWSSLQPMLTSLAFDHGNLLIGIRNRFTDQIGSGLGNLDPHDTDDGIWQEVFPIHGARGAILMACPTKSGTFALESRAECGGRVSGEVWNNAGLNIGPKGSMWFTKTSEWSLGSIVAVQEDTSLRTTMLDAGAITNGNGVSPLLYDTGARESGMDYAVYGEGDNQPNVYAKGNGLGDLEVMCDQAPIEIGNRVWFDKNDDGVQGADEKGIANVTVSLMTGAGTVAAKAVTDANGSYIFSAAAGTTTTSHIYKLQDVVRPNRTDLYVQVDLATVPPSVIASAHVTRRLGLGSPNASANNRNDNDAYSDGSTSPIALNSAGRNDTTVDVGLTATGNIADPPAVFTIGDTAFDDVDNNGVQAPSERGVTGVTVSLTRNGNIVDTTTTDASGHYKFDGIKAGIYNVTFASPATFALAQHQPSRGPLAGGTTAAIVLAETAPDVVAVGTGLYELAVIDAAFLAIVERPGAT